MLNVSIVKGSIEEFKYILVVDLEFSKINF